MTYAIFAWHRGKYTGEEDLPSLPYVIEDFSKKNIV
jgi:hypothetical protein